MCEKNLVECRPRYLIGLRIRDLAGPGEIRVLIRSPVRGREAGPPLFDEAGGGDDVFRANLCEDLVNPGKLRFADVEPRKTLSVKDQDATLSSRECARRRGSSRATSDDGDIKVPRLIHASG